MASNLKQVKPIRIFTSETMSFVNEVDHYESFQLIRRFHTTGEFELQMNAEVKGAPSFRKGRYLVLGNDWENAGVIDYVERVRDKTDRLIIKGQTLLGLLDRRLVVPPFGQSYQKVHGPGESCIKFLLNVNCVTNEEYRRFPIYNVPTKLRGGQIWFQSRLKVLLDELAVISMATGVGMKMSLEPANKRFVFDCYEGRNLTTSQTVNPPVIFSTEFDNIESLRYIETDANRKNTGYIGGDGEGKDRRIEIIDNWRSGINRYEVFIDARDIQPEQGENVPDSELRGRLRERGRQKLAEMRTEITLEAKIADTDTFAYRKDWDLGDIVTVEDKNWGIQMDARVIEVKEVYEPNKIDLEVVFGNAPVRLVDKMKQSASRADNEILR